MSPGEKEALDALARRLVHAQAIAAIVARQSVDEAETSNALFGVAAMLEDISERVCQIIERSPS